ncbi:hypothetical protein LJC11_03310 [Bacteroidales bacterium OttesenSCG-928-I21]|nr:hypothetical protein [Bacteroidales bacterium OttesenSCG-928-I21]
MKKVLIFICIIGFGINLKAQTPVSNSHIDARLYDVFSEEYLTNMQNSEVDEIEYWNWYLDNSYTIYENIPLEKCEGLPYLKYFDPKTKTEGGIVEDVDPENFNIFLYSVEPRYNVDSKYRIGNSNKVLSFESVKRLTEMYNEFLKK